MRGEDIVPLTHAEHLLILLQVKIVVDALVLLKVFLLMMRSKRSRVINDQFGKRGDAPGGGMERRTT